VNDDHRSSCEIAWPEASSQVSRGSACSEVALKALPAEVVTGLLAATLLISEVRYVLFNRNICMIFRRLEFLVECVKTS
jgi:hypothetical protein